MYCLPGIADTESGDTEIIPSSCWNENAQISMFSIGAPPRGHSSSIRVKNVQNSYAECFSMKEPLADSGHNVNVKNLLELNIMKKLYTS